MTLTKLLAVAALCSTAGSFLAPPAMAQAPEFAAQADPAPSVAAAGDIFATLSASGQFTTLLKAVDATNLTAVLKSAGPLTIFAPTDAAFAALPAGRLEALTAATPPAELQKLVLLHVINAKVDEAKIKGAKGPVASASGTPLYLDGSAGPLKVDNAAIVQTVPVSNGIVYVIDTVLSPTYAPSPAAK